MAVDPDLRDVPGVAVDLGAGLATIRARNPGPLTLEGTNTWIVGAVRGDSAVVVDPGPADPHHLAGIERHVRSGGRRIVAVVLTHGHTDHSEGAAELALAAGCGVYRAAGRSGAVGVRPAPMVRTLVSGDVIDEGGVELEVLATPGHSSDSVSLLVGRGRALITGDTILGRGTAVIAHPDGNLGDYLESLRTMRELVERVRVDLLLPGHGPLLSEPVEVIDGYLRHRAERLDQVRDAVRVLGRPLSPQPSTRERLATEVVELVYSDVPRVLWPAAGASVRAQLAHLFGPEDEPEHEGDAPTDASRSGGSPGQGG